MRTRLSVPRSSSGEHLGARLGNECGTSLPFSQPPAFQEPPQIACQRRLSLLNKGREREGGREEEEGGREGGRKEGEGGREREGEGGGRSTCSAGSQMMGVLEYWYIMSP